MKRLQDRVAVVTGAASGIGRATSIGLAKKGCHLALADVNEEGLRETAHSVEAEGCKASVHVVDVADKKRMQAFPEEVVREHGHAHIVVNNAGVSVTAPLEEQSLEDFEWIVGINFWGVVYGSKFFIPYLKKEDEGHIVNISSVFGIIGLPTQSSYAATKFAVRGFSESIRTELAPYNIGVTSVHPGLIKTNIVKSSRFGGDQSAKTKAVRMFEKSGMDPAEVARQVIRGIEKNKARVLVTRETHLIDLLKRVAPASANRLFNGLQKQMGL